VSSVETPETPEKTPAPEAAEPQPRRCPRCGSTLTDEQEWCLECGAGLGATIAAPPSWRGPVALVAVLLVIAAAALVLALVELAGDAEQVGEAPPATPTATPPPAAAVPTTTPAPGSTTIPPATDATATPGPTTAIAEWPEGLEAWTVVLESASTEEAAQQRAEELAGLGIPVGMLDSDDHGALEPGRNVVFSGQYDSQRAADQARSDLSDQVEGAYVVRVAPE
jgi:cell division septation protein DedD